MSIVSASPCVSCVDAVTPCPCPRRLAWEAATLPVDVVQVCLVCVDVEWLSLAGELPEQIAARLGSSLDALDAHLRRHGRADLIRGKVRR